ncbi:photosystem reaction center subunit H [Xaviernesmea oryzae]|uniref:Photosystem reaction center subunit H n=1 Tax=Xaviernesmea oryzae TaxID=464029 RepID=A0A1Q9AVP6_9HYPH|nr:PRC-barrel domain-containing protein [Xaviernesmea oryzae]OLP59509.1 photosystem reaction center subunit H [Xaviernesmea oryzae]SEL59229.1 PRC-barrel domain-containing protein [Xaviernesmea oryzae]
MTVEDTILRRSGLKDATARDAEFEGADRQDATITETHDLIASDKVEGTAVYGANDDHIGTIERLILEKRSGRVAYAVLSFGGFLGIGSDYYPLPWEKLTYHERLSGYRTDLTREQVEKAPKYRSDEDYQWDAANGRRVYDYYGVPPYWM